MKWTKIKTAITVGAAVMLALGVAAIVVFHHRTHPAIFSSTRDLTDGDNARLEKLTGTTPAEAARTFMEACSRGDVAGMAKYWPAGLLKAHPDFAGEFTNSYAGLEIISLGRPFKGRVIMFGGKDYPGVYVPYKIRLNDGTVKEWQLAIRCDNREHRWYWDGGM